MSTPRTRKVVRKYFTDLANGDLDTALSALSDDIVFDLPVDEWNRVIPYLGRHVGVSAVRAAFALRAETTEVLDYELRDLRADGDTAFAVIYTRARHTRTGQEFEIEDAHRLTVDEHGKIVGWRVYFDPNSEIAAFNADRDERFRAAVLAGEVALAAELTESGASVDTRDPRTGRTPLMTAADRADAAMVRLLIGSGADVFTVDTRSGATALHFGCRGGSPEVVKEILATGAFVDAVVAGTGCSPLHDALNHRHENCAAAMLDAGAAPDVAAHDGTTPRHLALRVFGAEHPLTIRIREGGQAP